MPLDHRCVACPTDPSRPLRPVMAVPASRIMSHNDVMLLCLSPPARRANGEPPIKVRATRREPEKCEESVDMDTERMF